MDVTPPDLFRALSPPLFLRSSVSLGARSSGFLPMFAALSPFTSLMGGLVNCPCTHNTKKNCPSIYIFFCWGRGLGGGGAEVLFMPLGTPSTSPFDPFPGDRIFEGPPGAHCPPLRAPPPLPRSRLHLSACFCVFDPHFVRC